MLETLTDDESHDLRQQERLSLHLARCASCREVARRLSDVNRGLLALAGEGDPDGIDARLLAEGRDRVRSMLDSTSAANGHSSPLESPHGLKLSGELDDAPWPGESAVTPRSPWRVLAIAAALLLALTIPAWRWWGSGQPVPVAQEEKNENYEWPFDDVFPDAPQHRESPTLAADDGEATSAWVADVVTGRDDDVDDPGVPSRPRHRRLRRHIRIDDTLLQPDRPVQPAYTFYRD